MAVKTPTPDTLKAAKTATPLDPNLLKTINTAIDDHAYAERKVKNIKTAKGSKPSDQQGFDKAAYQTFGPGAFLLSTTGGDSHDYKLPEDQPQFSQSGEPVHEKEYIAALNEATEQTIAHLFDFENSYSPSYSPLAYSPADNRVLDLSHEPTRTYVSQAKIMTDDMGGVIGIDTGMSCLRTGHDEDGNITEGESILRAKLAMEKPIDLSVEANRQAVEAAKMDEEAGYLDYNNMCIAPDSVEAIRVTEAKKALEQDPTGQTLLAQPKQEQAASAESLAINSQGNDLAFSLTTLEPPPVIFKIGPEKTSDQTIKAEPAKLAQAQPSVTAPALAPAI